LNKVALLLLIINSCLFADEVYDKNKKANKLYEQKKYAEALSVYEEALLESPENKKLSMNKGSTLYRLEDLEKAEESYKSALSVEDQKARADLLYNMGNLLNAQGDQLAMSGGPQAMEKFKAARDSYIKALDLKPSDQDAKWNLEITQQKIKQLEKQQQQQKNQDNKDKQNQKKDQNQKGDKNKQDQKNQKKDEQEKDKKDQEDKQQQEKKDEQEQQQKPQPQPQKSEEDMKKEEARRLLAQYADDANELNKPKKKVIIGKAKKPEKDW
jgi:tetratricopeptide (TPR) repeat protein